MKTLQEALFSRKNINKSYEEDTFKISHSRFNIQETLEVFFDNEKNAFTFSIITSKGSISDNTSATLKLYDIQKFIKALSSTQKGDVYFDGLDSTKITLVSALTSFKSLTVYERNRDFDTFDFINKDEEKSLIEFLKRMIRIYL